MKHNITALKWHKSEPDRIAMHLDGKPWASVSLIAAGRFKVGDRIDADTARQLKRDQQRRDAYQRALRSLSARDRSVFEIRQKLKRVGYDAATIDHVLDRLVENKYVDDQAFAVNWVNARMKASPRSARLMAQELKQNGIDPDKIDVALTPVDEHALALACIHRKRRRWRRLEGGARRQKILAYLSHKGFTYDVSHAALTSYRDQTD